MRLGLFGGVFNPPHLGHVVCAQEARIQLELDEVWLIPTGEPPHKSLDNDPGGKLRFEMCRRAIEGQPGLAVSDIEVNRPGISYSVDTLTVLNEQMHKEELFMILGADQASTMATWRNPAAIGRIVEVAVVDRGDVDRPTIAQAVVEATGKQPLFVEMPRIDVSSSFVRESAAAGRTVRHLVAAGVAETIELQGLYA